MSSAGSAETALRRGQYFLRSGRKSEAHIWLDRTHRLAPNDAMVRLLLSSTLVGVDEELCRSLLHDVLADHPDYREARLALIAAELRVGATARATDRLNDLLRTSAPPDSPGFRRLADRIARMCRFPGWLSVTAAGLVRVSLLPTSSKARIELRLDGRHLWSLRHDGRTREHCTRALPPAWKQALRLTASRDGRELLGSGVDLAALRRVQGFVAVSADGSLSGWAVQPADPDAVPELHLLALDSPPNAKLASKLPIRADIESARIASADGPVRRRGFAVPAQKLPRAAGLRIVGPDGVDILGSPIYPFAEQWAAREAARAFGVSVGTAARSGAKTISGPARAAGGPTDPWRPLSVGVAIWQSPRPRPVPTHRPIDVVIPVYRGAAEFVTCLTSLQRRWPPGTRVVVVDDNTPDPHLRAALEERASAREIILLRHDRNRGFPAAANTGLRHASRQPRTPRDVVLLNADTLVPPGGLARLAACAYRGGDIGSVTPLSNAGSIVSYPYPDETGPPPDLANTDRLDARLRAANGRRLVDLPTAVGFCMFIRHDCLAEAGLFREDVFAQGYGEENDWSLRARQLGWRHVAATGVFVGHIGGRSFGSGKPHLMARNLAILNRLHPGYDALIAEFQARDPLWQARFRADARAWADRRMARPAGGPAAAGSVILITHAGGGGVERLVASRYRALQSEGIRIIVLRPVTQESAWTGLACQVSDALTDDYPNLRFRLPQDLETLLALLRAEIPRHIEIHHLLGHPPQIMTVVERLGLPYRVFIHDYAFWCPRITLCTKGPRYCGEPLDPSDCEACVMDMGRRTHEDIPVAELRTRSARLLQQAALVVVPCEDVAGRMGRHFRRLRTTVIPWEDETELRQAYDEACHPPSPREPCKVVVVGAIGTDKGYDILLDCVRDAARRRLSLSFTVVGYTMDDARLMDSGPIFITGQFEEHEAVSLIGLHRPHIGFVPSICPETWCYSISSLWKAGLRTVAFALGAQAQRISRSGLGALLPLGLAPERINDALIRLAAGQRTESESGGSDEGIGTAVS